jgi:hypothetical protein
MHNSLSKPKITAALAPRHRAPLPTHRQRTAHRICPVRPPQGRPTPSSWPRRHPPPHRSRRKRPTGHRPTPSRPVTDRAGTTAVPAGQPASWGPGTASGRRRCRAKPKKSCLDRQCREALFCQFCRSLTLPRQRVLRLAQALPLVPAAQNHRCTSWADRDEPVDQPIAQTTVTQTVAGRVVSAAGTRPQTRAEINKGKNSHDHLTPCRTVPMAPPVDLAAWPGRRPQQRPPAAVPAALACPLSRPAPAPICPPGAPTRPHLSPPPTTTTAAPSTRVVAAAGLRHPYG